jgi:hypothetical protein
MSIKLNGATSGSVELDVPDAIGSDLSVTIPATAGDIVVKGTDGSVDLGDVNIDSSGRLLVGTSSDVSNGSSNVKAQIIESDFGALAVGRSGTTINSGTTIGDLRFYGNSGNTAAYGLFAQITCTADGSASSNTDNPGRLTFSTTADGASSPTERMRIDNNGQIQMGRTAPVGNERLALQGLGVPCGYFFQGNNSNVDVLELRNAFNQGGQTATYIRFADHGGTTRGSITGTTSGTAYNTSSDYRLKENVVPLTGAIDRLNQLQVRRFNFIADPDTTVDGFLAHEAQEVVPECVTGTKDEVDDEGNPVYQGIDQAKLVPLLTAALQKAIGRIETLEASNAALETRLTALEGGAS